jgi:hypothetical protein
MPAGRPHRGKGASAEASAAPTSEARTAELKPGDVGRAPFSRHAQACTMATHLQEPSMGSVDTALAEYAPLVTALAEDITASNNYFLRGGYKEDDFAKGKLFHDRLTKAFAQLDDSAAKVGQALVEWHKAHPASSEGLDEGQKLALVMVDDARNIIPPIVGKADPEGFKSAIAQLETDAASFRKFAEAQTTGDPWTLAMITPIDALLKDAKEAQESLGEDGLSTEAFSRIATEVVFVIEQKQRAAAHQKGGRPNKGLKRH